MCFILVHFFISINALFKCNSNGDMLCSRVIFIGLAHDLVDVYQRLFWKRSSMFDRCSHLRKNRVLLYSLANENFKVTAWKS